MSHDPYNWIIKRYIGIPIDASSLSDFAHYSSLHSIENIISSGEVWLKKTSEMNDVQEIIWGINIVKEYFLSSNSSQFWSLLDSFSAGISYKIKQSFESWTQDLLSETYITCFTEHDNNKPYGRLSMWRGYGCDESAAIIISKDFLLATENPYGIISTPVFYYTRSQILEFFSKFFMYATSVRYKLSSNNQSVIIEAITDILKTCCFSFKHPGFEEECELRVVYRPSENSAAPLSKPTAPSNSNHFYSLPVSVKSNSSIGNVNLQKLLEKVIVGPVREDRKHEIKDRLNKVLQEQNITVNASTLTFSDIPVRLK